MIIERFMRRHEVAAVVGLQRSSIYRLMSLGEFPRPHRLTKSGKAVGWRESDVLAWMESRTIAQQ